MIKKTILLAILILFSISLCYAETVRLLSGNEIQGSILGKNDDYIKIKTKADVTVTYYYDEIKQILDGNKIIFDNSIANQKQIEEEASEYINNNLNFTIKDSVPTNKPGNKHENIEYIPEEIISQEINDDEIDLSPENKSDSLNDEEINSQIEVIAKKIDAINKDFIGEAYKWFKGIVLKMNTDTDRLNSKFDSLKAILKIFPKKLIISYAISWIFCCLPLLILALRLRAPQPWLAFIPFMQFILLLRISEKPTSWVFYFIFPVCVIIIPFFQLVNNPVNWFFVGTLSLIISFYVIHLLIWSNIISFFQKPRLLAILMLIPFVNIFLHIYLAIPKKNNKRKKRIKGRF